MINAAQSLVITAHGRTDKAPPRIVPERLQLIENE